MAETEVASIVIIKSFDAAVERTEEVMTIRAEYSDGLTLVDAMGMLSFALQTCLEDYRRNAEEADEGLN